MVQYLLGWAFIVGAAGFLGWVTYHFVRNGGRLK
jgi:hypothetical protein